MSTFVSRDFRRGGPKSREEYDVILKIGQDQHSMDAATSEYSVIVNRDGEHVHVSPRRNEEGEWELDLYGRRVVFPGGFPFEVTLPQFRHLQVLQIRTKGIRTIPEGIKDLENVTRLWLVEGDLEGFPSAVCQLNKLTQLDLSGNEKIKEIPPGTCGKMKRLRVLYMYRCGLTCLPEDLDQMVNLERLDLRDNSLSHLGNGLKNMTKLTYVDLGDNPFESLEEEFPFDTLVNIERLSLDQTNMKTLPGGIGQMVKIKSISLYGNQLQCLPKEICNLPSDATVILDDNPLSSPPLDVCESGMPSIKSYFQSLEGNTAVKRTKRTKMIVLGESQSGKSSLIRAILLFLKDANRPTIIRAVKQLFKGTMKKDICVKEEVRTIGIDQHRVSLKDVDLVVLDSGGQRSYSPINQLFTSNSCLVIITADAKQYTVTGEMAFRSLVRPYLQRIYDYVKAAVVLPVITKADLVTHDQLQLVITDLGHKILEFQKERESIMDKQRQQHSGMSTERQNITVITKKLEEWDESQQEYEERCVSRIMSTSARTAVGLNILLGYVNELLQDRSLFPGLDTLLPSSWVNSEDQLQSLAKIHSPPIRSLPATCDVIVPCGVSPENAQGLLSYLHTVGSICHYDQHPSLRQHVFLQPQFLIDLLKAVYHHQLNSILTMDSIPPSQRSLVTPRELKGMLTKLNENGIASVKLLRLIWSKFGFKEEHDNLMIKLLVSFNFAYVRCDNEHVIETVNALVEDNVDQGSDDLLGLLKKHNGDLLLPWFFHDKKPDGLPTVCPSDQSVSVCLTYSFSMSLPEGLFERVSARCHRHSNSTHHWLSGVHMEYAAITAVLQCDEGSAEMVLSASTVRSLNAYDRLWQVVWRLIIDIENEIKQAPGTVHTVQRYISASSLNSIQSVPGVGAREDDVQLHKDFPVFQMNAKDPVAREVEKHKVAVAHAQAFIKLPLANVLSPENGQEVTEQDGEDVAFLIENESTVSKLSFALRVKETSVESTDVCARAFAVINKWRQSTGYACVSILRDALHRVGLQKVDKSVFGHIRDCTLSEPEAGSSLPETVHLEGKSKSTTGEQIVLVSHCRDSIGMVGFADMSTRNFQVATLSYCTLNCVVLCIELLSENKVFQAVLKLGVAQWHSIGLQMGLTGPQIKACTFDIPSLGSKLEALIELKIRECGVKETEKCLLCACERIPEPIIGSVMDFIKSGSSGITEHESLNGECD